MKTFSQNSQAQNRGAVTCIKLIKDLAIDKMVTRYLYIIFLLAVCRSFRRTLFARGDSYASIAEMEQIVNLEVKLGESLEKYVELEKKRLQQIKQFAESVKEATNRVKTDGIKTLENPTSTYAIIKRFANGWSEIGKFLDKDYSNGKYHYFVR